MITHIRSIGRAFAVLAALVVVLATPAASTQAQVTLNPNLLSQANVLSSASVAVTCDISLSSDTVFVGDSVTVSWNTTGLDTIEINGETVSGDTGSKVFNNITENTVFTLVGTTNDGSSCNATANLACEPVPSPEPERPACPYNANDDTLVYNFTETLVSHRGVDRSETAVASTNLEPGLYKISLTAWDGYENRANVLQDNERWQLSFQNANGEISRSSATSDIADGVDEAVVREVVDTRFELTETATGVQGVHAGFPDTSSPNSLHPICAAIEKIEVEVPPEMPTCPFTPSDTVTVFEFDERLRSDRGDDEGSTVVRNTNLEAGRYNISLASWDGYLGRENTSQPNETWQLSFMDANGEVVRSSTISDVPDNVREGFVFEQANANLEIATTITSVQGVHAVYPDTSSANSVYPVCAAVEKVVEEKPVLSCDLFTATPVSITAGESVDLTWETTNGTRVVIDNGVGEVSEDGTVSVSPSASTTYTLTVFDADNNSVDCTTDITVVSPEVFTCENNVSFTATDTSIKRGGNTTLNWNVTNADSVTISEINASTLTGSETVSPSSDTTYVLTATKDNKSIECPLAIDVSTGGGGGGSSSPRCEFEISAERIDLGDEVVLTWETTRAREVTITDDEGKVLVSTDGKIASEKKDLFDSSLTVTPTRDTTYTLLVERGSRDRKCEVSVEIANDVVILETREQRPLVAGIALSTVPHTGFEAGPVLTSLFYLLLVAWAFYIAYVLIARKQLSAAEVETGMTNMETAEATRPDVFVNTGTTTPANLPVADTQTNVGAITATGAAANDVENHAHAQKALLSSDAVQHFMTIAEDADDRLALLDEVIAQAKEAYPLEDGWMVINESRMQNVCETCKAKNVAVDAAAVVPQGSSSLAEAIVTGNVVAAYELIGNQPMFALADAAADFDAVYRKRQGEDKIVSDLLLAESNKLSDEQLKEAISALTSALDGTYTDEASAVKMAIMKTVKAVA